MKKHFKMLRFMTLFIFLLAGGVFARPNFIIIYTDDQGYGDLSSYGNIALETPNIDRMAEEGIRMTDFYSGYPICTPSRAALLTGLYPERLELGNNLQSHENDVLYQQDEFGLNPNEVNLADLLRANGYATACIGKWHLGHIQPFLPTKQGFDYYFGIPYSNDMRPTYLMYMEDTLRHFEWSNPGIPDGEDSLTMWYTDSAIAYIEKHKDSSFFVYLAHSMPHWPVFASPEFQGRTNSIYNDVIEEIDYHTGRLLDSLRSWGLATNTLVMFASDNGPSARARHGSNGPLSGHKKDNLEGGMRVPGIFWWPEHFPSGQISGKVASVLDIYTTFAGLAKVGLPRDYQSDGEDISDILLGVPGADRSTPFYYDLSAIRIGDWKFFKDRRVRNLYTSNVNELYDVRGDLDESDDVSSEYPALADSMLNVLDAFVADLNDNIRPRGTLNTVVLKQGCMDSTAFNYDPEAGVDNGTCRYELSAKPPDQSGKGFSPGPRGMLVDAEIYHGLEVYDIHGREVFKVRFLSSRLAELKHRLERGVYLIKLRGATPSSLRWVNL